MDSFLRQLERKAQQGDTDALWQAYYALKRITPALTIQNLRDLAESCQDEIHRHRSFELWWGSNEKRHYSVDIPEDGKSIEQIALGFLKKSDYYHSWFQGSKYVKWQLGAELVFYRSASRYNDKVVATSQYQVLGSEIPLARHIYLVWLKAG